MSPYLESLSIEEIRIKMKLVALSLFVEYRIQFGRVKSEMKFPFAFALAFRYICRVFL